MAGAPNSVRWCTELSDAPINSSPTPTVGLVVGAINTLNHHHFKASKFSAIAFNTRALDFTPRHKTKDQILSKSQTHSKDLVACERERHLCLFEFLSLGSLFFFHILVLNTFVIKARDTNRLVVLVGSK
jgi:hypothetical protein